MNHKAFGASFLYWVDFTRFFSTVCHLRQISGKIQMFTTSQLRTQNYICLILKLRHLYWRCLKFRFWIYFLGGGEVFLIKLALQNIIIQIQMFWIVQNIFYRKTSIHFFDGSKFQDNEKYFKICPYSVPIRLDIQLFWKLCNQVASLSPSRLCSFGYFLDKRN